MYHRCGKSLLAACILLTTFLSQVAAAQTKTIEEIVAWVNNDVILKSEYESRRAQLREDLAQPAPRGPGLQGAQLEQAFNDQSKLVLRLLIDESLILQQARDMGLSADTEVIKAMDRLHAIYAHREDRVDYFAFLDLLQQIPAGAKQAQWDELVKHAAGLAEDRRAPSHRDPEPPHALLHDGPEADVVDRDERVVFGAALEGNLELPRKNGCQGMSQQISR